MKCFTKWLGATLAVALLANTAAAADMVSSGKVKSVNGESKSFVLTDAENKDFTFKLADDVLVNRGGKESNSDLKAGDTINVFYDKGIVTWTAKYILVKDGKSQNWGLYRGSVKSYDADKKELTFTDLDKKDMTYSTSNATVRLNRASSKIDDVKIGDRVLVILDTHDGKSTIHSVMVDRK